MTTESVNPAAIIAPTETPAAPAAPVAPGALSGWAAFQRAVNVTLPGQLSQAAAVRRRTLAVLGGN